MSQITPNTSVGVASISAPVRDESHHQYAVQIEQVSRHFTADTGPMTALHDVSINVRQGEFLSLVGPSGCGKSTLLRLIAGLDFPDSGAVLLDGEKVRKPSLERGILFQDHRLLPWLTVEANIELSLHKSGLDKTARRARVDELINLVGLDGFAKAWPWQLSGGMSQRAAIARSLAPRPKMLLLDEPLGALDSLTRAKMQAELLRIWEHERLTTIMVTHDVEEAVYLSDRIVVMHAKPGRIAQVLDVSAPRPRHRGDEWFGRLKADVLAHLGIEDHAH